MNYHGPGQGIPDKKDQKSPGEHRNIKKENQPCDKTKNNSTESATDCLDPDLPETAKEETPEDPSSAPALVKTKRAPNHDVGNKAISAINGIKNIHTCFW